VLSFQDVDQPSGRLVDVLWRDQCELWPHAARGPQALAIH